MAKRKPNPNKFFEEVLQNRARLIRLESQIAAEADVFFNEMKKQWAKELRRYAASGTKPTATERAIVNRQAEILRNMNAITDSTLQNVERWMGSRVTDAGVRESLRVQEMLDAHARLFVDPKLQHIPGVAFNEVNRGAIRSAIGQDLIGRRMTSSFAKISAQTKERMKRDLVDVISRGLGPDALMKKWLGASGSASSRMVSDAKALARTALMAASNEGHQAVYRENKHLFPRVRWEATFDDRTCAVCGALHGKEFDNDKAPPIPAHLNCRCVLVPVFATQSLNDELETLHAERQPDGSVQFRKVPGSTPHHDRFSKWIRNRDPDTQRDFFGSNLKYRAFRDNQLPLERMVRTYDGHVLTDKEVAGIIKDKAWLKNVGYAK